MPWKLEKAGDGWFVVNAETGKRMSKKPLPRERAAGQLRLLYSKMNSGEIKERPVGPIFSGLLPSVEKAQRLTKAGKPYKKNRGYMPGLAKHLGHKLGGDPGFFTKCMAEEEIAHYDNDMRASICARAHYYVTGIWPGHHGGLNPNGPEGGESELTMPRSRSRRRRRKERRADVSEAEKRYALRKYGHVHFADEANNKYPLDSVAHIRAAWNYIHQAKNAAKYADGGAHIRSDIIAAWKREINPNGPPGIRRRTALHRRKEDLMAKTTKGGPGSGFFGHSGRSGTAGGSTPGLGRMSADERVGYHRGLARAYRNQWKKAATPEEGEMARVLFKKHAASAKKLSQRNLGPGGFFFNIKERLKHGGSSHDQSSHGNWATGGGGGSAASRGYRNNRMGRAMAKRDAEREAAESKKPPAERIAGLKRSLEGMRADLKRYPNNKDLQNGVRDAERELRALEGGNKRGPDKITTMVDKFLVKADQRHGANSDDWVSIYRDANALKTYLNVRRRDAKASSAKKKYTEEIQKVRDLMDMLEMEHDEEYTELYDSEGPGFFKEKRQEPRAETEAHGGTVVFKDAKGDYRWVLFSSSAYQDHDKEIVSTKALEEDCERLDALKDYGPLRWWHVPGADLGTCDFNMVHGRVLIESGTFNNEALAKVVMKEAPHLQVSIGFHHRPDEPDGEGVFHHIRRFERSLTPAGRASNEFTSVVLVKGDETMSTIKEKIEALKTMLGDDKLVEEILSQSDEAQKAAAAAGKAFKEKAEAEAEDAKPVEPEAEVTEEKAAPKKPSKEKDESEEMDEADVEEEEDEFEDEEEFEDEDEEESKDFEPVFMGDLPIVGFVDMLAESVARALDPMLTEVRTLHKELTTVKEALDAKVAEKEADSKDLTELKAKTAATEKAVTDLTKKVSGLIADAPAAAKPYIASQADDNTLSEDKAKEMRDKSNLPHPPDGLSQFMNDFIGFKSNG